MLCDNLSPGLTPAVTPAVPMAVTIVDDEPAAQDVLVRTEKFIVDQELLDRKALQQMRSEIAAEVDEAVATAQQEDPPQANEEDWCGLSTRSLMDQFA